MSDHLVISRVNQEEIEHQNDTSIAIKPQNAINAICVAGTATITLTTDREHQINTHRQTKVDTTISTDQVDTIPSDLEIEPLSKVDFDRIGVEIRHERIDRLIEMTGTNLYHDQTIVHLATIIAIKSEPMNKNLDNQKDRALSPVISFML